MNLSDVSANRSIHTSALAQHAPTEQATATNPLFRGMRITVETKPHPQIELPQRPEIPEVPLALRAIGLVI